MTIKQQLLDAAESRARAGGYNNFSFRDLAAEVGIKSASVHYHFKTKGDLGAELARRYAQNFIAGLGDANALLTARRSPVKHFCDMFRKALNEDGKMCLCGVFASEADGLPDEVRTATAAFFEQICNWLEHALMLEMDLSQTQAATRALTIVASLEGAMLIAKISGVTQKLDQVIREIVGD